MASSERHQDETAIFLLCGLRTQPIAAKRCGRRPSPQALGAHGFRMVCRNPTLVQSKQVVAVVNSGALEDQEPAHSPCFDLAELPPPVIDKLFLH